MKKIKLGWDGGWIQTTSRGVQILIPIKNIIENISVNTENYYNSIVDLDDLKSLQKELKKIIKRREGRID